MVLASAQAFAQQAAPEPTLKQGSEVKLEAVTSATWIQGEAPKSFEPGKIYIFECWATWCGPCVAAIPHVNGLYKKFHEKGLNVYGMNVWEDGQEKVEKFVKAKGDGMSYPVAYTGKGSAFENDWLKAANVRGIPHAFIVKDGKLLFTTHPARLSEELIEALLAGGDSAQKALDGLNASTAAQDKTRSTMMEFQKASMANDAETMAAKIAELEKADPKSAYLAPMKYDLLIAKKDWAAAISALEAMPDGPARQMSILKTANKVSSGNDGDFPSDFIKTITKSYEAMVQSPSMAANPLSLIPLSRLQWKSGDKETALTTAKKALETAKTRSNKADASGMKLPVEPFERFTKSLEGGNLPDTREFSGWLREAMGRNNPDKATKKD